ncbi:hypothetical protein AQJ91_43335 [Streptomyces dysideae]|uniref:Uncharacterized protein n=1 Tax=Streptomyces dysideae TaxID=909626 RepID=A0A101UQL3_9ACTN|nr:hypothetical protein AQJ91_43335 [Streptomyces dysideae]
MLVAEDDEMQAELIRRQAVHVGNGLAFLGFRPQMVGRQQRGEPVLGRRVLARPPDYGNLALISHHASIT